MIKQCGNCRFWDRDHSKTFESSNHIIADCLSDNLDAECFLEPDYNGSSEKYPMIETEGEDCYVYKEKS